MKPDVKFTRRALLIGAGATTAAAAGVARLVPSVKRATFPPAEQITTLDFNVKSAPLPPGRNA